jgi:hypothetical protein
MTTTTASQANLTVSFGCCSQEPTQPVGFRSPNDTKYFTRRQNEIYLYDWSDNGEFSDDVHELAEQIISKRKQAKT